MSSKRVLMKPRGGKKKAAIKRQHNIGLPQLQAAAAMMFKLNEDQNGTADNVELRQAEPDVIEHANPTLDEVPDPEDNIGPGTSEDLENSGPDDEQGRPKVKKLKVVNRYCFQYCSYSDLFVSYCAKESLPESTTLLIIFKNIIQIITLFLHPISHLIMSILIYSFENIEFVVYISCCRGFYRLLKGRTFEAKWHSTRRDYIAKRRISTQFYYAQIYTIFLFSMIELVYSLSVIEAFFIILYQETDYINQISIRAFHKDILTSKVQSSIHNIIHYNFVIIDTSTLRLLGRFTTCIAQTTTASRLFFALNGTSCLRNEFFLEIFNFKTFFKFCTITMTY